MASAEFAAALPAVILVAVMSIHAVGWAIDSVRCLDAARATARLLARGDPAQGAISHGRRLAPVGAKFAIAAGPELIEVRVAGPGGGGPSWLAGLSLLPAPTGTALAAREDVSGPDASPGPGPGGAP